MTTRDTTKNWSMIVGGLLLVFFALVAALFPGLTLVSITFIIAAGFLVASIIDLMTYFKQRKLIETSGWVLAYALIDILIALMLFFHPLAAAFVLPWLVGFFVLAFGLFEVATSFVLRRAGAQLWPWTLCSGAAGALLGVGLFVWPSLLVYYLAFFTIVRGISLIVMGANFNRIV